MSLQPVATTGLSTVGGGAILTPAQDFVRIDGRLVDILGTPVADHGDDDHNAALTANATSHVRINGVPISRQSEVATCGHPIATGSDWVRADG